jgi:predicted PhzF superfamily epimerase YddE/YHI9
VREIEIAQVDAFADRPFTGNPAAVCVLPRSEAWDERWMQSVAMEMNLSETAFARPVDPARFELRWFTPTDEVRLCGHATLATAHHLWESGAVASGQAVSFETKSGTLKARPSGSMIELDFPAIALQKADEPAELARAFDVKFSYLGRGSNGYHLLEAASDAEVRAAKPDLTLLGKLREGVILTASSASAEFDFVSRFFSAHDGIGEDPVTGSAHCILAPFWASRLGKPTMKAFQASRRGGRLEVEIRGERVLLRGRAVTVLRGKLTG